MDKLREVLRGKIEEEIEELDCMTNGSIEKKETIDGIVKLYSLYIEDVKIESDSLHKGEQLEDGVKDRKQRLYLETAAIVVPMAFYALWMHKGFKFEESGTFTSTTFRGLFNRFKPTLK